MDTQRTLPSSEFDKIKRRGLSIFSELCTDYGLCIEVEEADGPENVFIIEFNICESFCGAIVTRIVYIVDENKFAEWMNGDNKTMAIAGRNHPHLHAMVQRRIKAAMTRHTA